MIKNRLAVALAIALIPVALAAAGATLSGTVTVQGRIEKVKLTKKFNPYGGVYKDDKPVAELSQDLVVYLEGLPPTKAPASAAVLSQKERNFTSSIVPVLPGGEVEIRNADTIRHHIRSNTKPWDFNLKPKAPGETATKAFAAPADKGLGVVPVYCDIHSNMRAHVLVMPSAKWQLLPETGGAFKLSGIPAGTYTLTAWHPTLKAKPVKVTLKAGATKKVELIMLGKQE
jgi:plastocyanin